MNQLTVCFDEDIAAALADESKRTGTTRNQLIRDLLKKNYGPKIGAGVKVMNFKVPNDAEIRELVGVPDNVT